LSRRDNQTASQQNSACVIVAPRQSSPRRDHQKMAILIVAAFPSRLSRYSHSALGYLSPIEYERKHDGLSELA
jgi:hypothetical protein